MLYWLVLEIVGRPDTPVQKATRSIVNNQRFGLYGFLGMITAIALLLKLTGCASPARAEFQAESSSPVVILDQEFSVTSVREDSRLVVRGETTDEVAPDALSAPIVGFEENDALIDAGLSIGDEVLLISDGFESTTVDSAGTLEDAFIRIAAAVDDNDSYLDVLVRREGRNWWITVAATPTT